MVAPVKNKPKAKGNSQCNSAKKESQNETQASVEKS
jgi:hypothetical protein